MRTPPEATSRKPRAAVDWLEIHRRMAAAAAAVERGASPTREELQRILRRRAEKLASRQAPRPQAGETIEILEFALASERYGVETVHIREVAPLAALTPMPCVPPFVLGITSLRARVLALIDLKKFFELPEQGLTNVNRIIVLGSEDTAVGLLADAVIGVRSCSIGELQTSLPTLTGLRADYLKGIGPDGVAVLDAQKLLADSRLVVHEDVRA